VISQGAAIRLLTHERNRWKMRRYGANKNEFGRGYIEGLSWAIAAIMDLGRETAERMKDNPRYVASLFRKGQ
jgi:hypothetical protein